jgi:cobalt-zinc-cadmium efflux system outer membrane protein
MKTRVNLFSRPGVLRGIGGLTLALTLTLTLAPALIMTRAASATATAGAKVVEGLTLEEAIERAERMHPELAESRALVEAARGRADQAGRFPNPEAIARIEEAPLNSRNRGEAQILAGVAQPVPLGGRLSKAREAERMEQELRFKELAVRRLEIRRRVHSAFATALFQTRAFQTQTVAAEGADKIAALTRARVEAGDAPPADLARAEMELHRATVERNRSASLHDQALFALAAAIGEPGLAPGSLAGTLEAALEIPALQSLTADLASHPLATAAEAAIRMRRAWVEVAKAERIPDIQVELLYRRPQDGRDHAFDVGLSVPLPLFDRNRGRIREARAELDAAEARSAAAKNDLVLRFREAHARLATALASSRALRSEILPRAGTVLNAAEARYAAGDISLGEILPVRREATDVQLAYLESLRDVMEAWGTVRSLVNSR